MEVKAFLFDFGNVIGFFDYDIALVRMSALTAGHSTPQAIREKILDSGLARELESGSISGTTFLAQLKKELSLTQVRTSELASVWSDIFRSNEAVATFIKEIPPGIKLILASNTNELHYAHFSHQFADVLSRFDSLVLSYQIKHMKPAPQFYAACVQAAGCRPAECCYFDDIADYIAAAQTLGINGIVYTAGMNITEALQQRHLEM